ncbi:MAG TPA: FAD binding domain-containing protein [Anaerolineae bacterium]|nr:FAD binding domain-containing protein [Anaerolineae bacterium]
MRDITEYYRPKHLAEALALLARSNVRTVPIGGGSKLIAEARRDVEAVVDLRDLNLSSIKLDRDMLRVGATATLQSLLDSPESAQAWGGELARAIQHTAARNLREQGTLAGTLVAAASHNPLAVMLLALGASLTMLTPERRVVALDEFFPQRQTLLRGGLIIEASIPLPRPGEAAAFEKVSRTPADLPIVCAAVRARLAGGSLGDARIALGGVGPIPLRALKTERALAGQLDAAALLQLADDIGPPSDFLGSAEYRREMAAVLVRRAIERLR